MRKGSRQEAAALAAVDNLAERAFLRHLRNLGSSIPVPVRTGCTPISGHSVHLSRTRHLSAYEFIVTPDHIHLLLAPKPTVALERAMQFIKGGYSHRFMKETGSRMEIWQRSFTNHRIQHWTDFEKHRRYIHLNPVRAGLVEFPRDYPYSSAHAGFPVDEAPRG